MNKCHACDEPIRRGYPKATNTREKVIICERCNMRSKCNFHTTRCCEFVEHEEGTDDE